MKTKRRIFIISLAAILLALGAYQTLAYFTAKAQADNVVTTGKIAVSVVEKMLDASGAEVAYVNPTNIVANADVSKIARVQNDGTADEWIRVKAEASWDNKTVTIDETAYTLDPAAVEIKYNTTASAEHGYWIDGGDGYYYYSEKVAAGAQTYPLFNEYHVNENIGNEYQEQTATITVKAYAVQADNNGDAVTAAAGWPAE